MPDPDAMALVRRDVAVDYPFLGGWGWSGGILLLAVKVGGMGIPEVDPETLRAEILKALKEVVEARE